MNLWEQAIFDENLDQGTKWFIKDQASRRCMICLLPPASPVSLTDDTQEDWERETTCWREREGGGGGAKSYDGEEAWSSLYYSFPPREFKIKVSVSEIRSI